jgi:hypothetical protein
MSTVIAMTAAGVDALTDDLVATGHVDTNGAILLTTKGGTDINIGNGVQDSDLVAISNLIPANDDLIQRKSGVWVNRTMAQVLADLGSDINTIENLTPANNDVLQRKSGAWANRTIPQLATDLLGDPHLGMVVLKTGSTNRTATTVLDDPDIHINLDPNSTYDMSFDCSYGGAVAMTFGWTVPAGVTGFRTEVYNLAGTGTGCYTSTWGAATTNAGAVTPGYKASGYLVTAAAGGNFAFRWGSSTSGQLVTLGTSILRLRKITP